MHTESHARLLGTETLLKDYRQSRRQEASPHRCSALSTRLIRRHSCTSDRRLDFPLWGTQNTNLQAGGVALEDVLEVELLDLALHAAGQTRVHGAATGEDNVLVEL